MDVHQSGDDDQSGQIHRPVVRSALPGGCDAAPLDGQITLFETAAAENPGAGIYGLHGCRRKKIGQPKQLP